MKTLKIVQVTKAENNNIIYITYVNKQGILKTITRIPRKHTKEVRELQKKGIYCFEISGILYWYKAVKIERNTCYMEEYKDPEDFRSEERKTNVVVEKKQKQLKKKTTTKAKKEGASIVLEHPVKTKQENIVEEETEVKHKLYDDILTMIDLDIPVYLAGEAGTGKNYTVEQISWDLGLPFYCTSSIQQEYKLTGFIDAGGKYHETEFYKAFTEGGIFFLDEIDASIPEVLVLLNMAIANRYFEFPCGRKTAHKDFRVVAAGNTVGQGADDLYTGRLQLDASTLDRFAIIEFDYDYNIEMQIAKGNKQLVDFVEGLRKHAKENGIRQTFSYRCIEMMTKLESKFGIVKSMKYTILGGMDKDTISCLDSDLCVDNKYQNMLEKIKTDLGEEQ